jgi:hypothetical protein
MRWFEYIQSLHIGGWLRQRGRESARAAPEVRPRVRVDERSEAAIYSLSRAASSSPSVNRGGRGASVSPAFSPCPHRPLKEGERGGGARGGLGKWARSRKKTRGGEVGEQKSLAIFG